MSQIGTLSYNKNRYKIDKDLSENPENIRKGKLNIPELRLIIFY